MKKVQNIIEYQGDRQRTPEEVLEHLKNMIDKGYADKIIILYHNDSVCGSAFAAKNRDYKNYEILWDMENYIHKELMK